MKNVLKRSLLLVSAFIAILLYGCSNASVKNNEINNFEKSVAMVFPGKITDGVFNQEKYNGLIRAGKDNNIKTAYIDNVSQSEQEEIIKIKISHKYERFFFMGTSNNSVIRVRFPYIILITMISISR